MGGGAAVRPGQPARARPRATLRRMANAGVRTRVDDASAIVDALLAHALVAVCLGVAIAGLAFPSLRHGVYGSLAITAVALARLALHPLRLAQLHRVYLDDAGGVHLASALGRARPVAPLAIEHAAHAAWPCALVLADGSRASFVARRDDGVPAFFLPSLSDRARYEGEREARDSLVDLHLRAGSRPPFG